MSVQKIQIAFLLFVSISFFACKETLQVPKPRTYPRIDLPKHEYVESNLVDCPFEFKLSKHAEIKIGGNKNIQEQHSPCWYTIHYTKLKADIFLSYVEIENREAFDKLVFDTHKVVRQVNKRSEYTDESRITNQYGVSGVQFTFEGDAASPMQFYLSDTTQHFLRAALYFNTQARADSLEPITNFVKEDISEILGSFKWK